MEAQDSDLASLKVDIAFQAGQIQMTAGEVQSLAPGILLPLDSDESDFLEIIANGKRIGFGELVKVGDKIAVRVTRLSANG